MVETIIVIAVVIVAIALSARSLYGTLTGKDEGCGCSSDSCSREGCSLISRLEVGEKPNGEAKTP